MKNPKAAIAAVVSEKRIALRINEDRVSELEGILSVMRKNAKDRARIENSLKFTEEQRAKAETELNAAIGLEKRIHEYSEIENKISELVAMRNSLCPSMLLQSELKVADRQA